MECKTKKSPTFFLAVFSISVFLPGVFSAQPYESIFGNGSSSWNIEASNSSGVWTDSLYSSGDTVIAGSSCKVVEYADPEESTFYFNEDTLTGRVSYFSESDTTVKHIMDMSLTAGDSFYVSGAWVTYPRYYKVDTAYIDSGRKHVVLNMDLNYAAGEKLTFIEGVGTNAGIIYKERLSLRGAPYLLCAWKDDTKIFSNAYHEGKCRINTVSADEKLREGRRVLLYPNPASNHLNVEFSVLDGLFAEIELINTAGSTVWRERVSAGESETRYTLNISGVSPGLYFFTVRAGDRIVFVDKLSISR